MFKKTESEQQYKKIKNNEEILEELINQIVKHSDNMKNIIELMARVRWYKEKIYAIQLELRNELSDILSERDVEEIEYIREQIEIEEEGVANIGDWIFDPADVKKICTEAQNRNIYPTTIVIEKLRKLVLDKKAQLIHGITMYEYEEEARKIDAFYISRDKSSICYTTGFCSQVFEKEEPDEIGRNMHVYITSENLEKLAKGQCNISRSYGKQDRESMKIIKKIESDCINGINAKKIAQVLQYYERELSYWQEIKMKQELEKGDTVQFLE